MDDVKTNANTTAPMVTVAADVQHHGLVVRIGRALQNAEQWVVDEFHRLVAEIEGTATDTPAAGSSDAGNDAAVSASTDVSTGNAPTSDAAPASSDPAA